MMLRIKTILEGPRTLLAKSWVAVVVMLALMAAACGGDDDIAVAIGRQLEFVATAPQVAERVIFTDGLGRTRVLRPRASNRQLAVVDIIVVNRSTTVVSLLLNEATVELGDRRSDRLEAIDPFNADVPEGEVDVRGAIVIEENPLWGEVEVNRGFQISGWFVFDVPKGLILGTIWWNQADTVSLDFIEY